MKDKRNTTVRLPPGVIDAIDKAVDAERQKYPGRPVSRNGLISETLTSKFGVQTLQLVAKNTRGVNSNA